MRIRGASVLAVVAGLLSDIALTQLLGVAGSIAALGQLACQGVSAADAQRFIEASSLFAGGMTVLGTAATAAGGCVAGLMAPDAPLRHGLVVGILSLAYSAAMMALTAGAVNAGGEPLWLTIAGAIAVVPAAALGGRLGAMLKG